MPIDPVEWGTTLTKVVAVADFTMNTNVLDDVPGLSWPVETFTYYVFEIMICFHSGSANSGIGIACVAPSTPTIISYVVDIPQASPDGVGATYHGYGSANGDEVLSTGVPAVNTNYIAKIQGLFKNGTGAGDFKVQVRPEVNSQLLTIRTGSGGDMMPRL